MEYKLAAASTWTAITGSSVTGLATGSYVVRVKATSSTFKSVEVSVTISPYGAGQEATPNATIDYVNEKLTGLAASANYAVNGGTKTADASGTILIESGWFETTVSIKKTGNGTTTVDSNAQSLTIPARPAAPAGVTGGASKITGTTALMEYKTASGTAVGTNSASYTPVTSATGTLYYKVIVTNTNNAVNGITTSSATSAVVAITVTIFTWTATTSTFGTNDIDAIAYGDGKFVAGGFDQMAYSPDGTTWTAGTLTAIIGTRHIYGMAYGNNKGS